MANAKSKKKTAKSDDVSEEQSEQLQEKPNLS